MVYSHRGVTPENPLVPTYPVKVGPVHLCSLSIIYLQAEHAFRTDNGNLPLNLLTTMENEINGLKTAIENFPDPIIRAKAQNIVNRMEHRNGQLFVGPSIGGNTPYLQTMYRPLDLGSLVADLKPVLELSLELELRPQMEIHAKIDGQNQKIDGQNQKIDALINSGRAEREVREKELELREKELKVKEEEIMYLRARIRKTEHMNAVYDFVSKCERYFCQLRNIEAVTFNQGVQGNLFALEGLVGEFNLGNISGQTLVETVKVVKDERLEHGHAPADLRKSLRLRDSLFPLVEEHFGLTVRQRMVISKLKDWAVDRLGEYATLNDLFEIA